ncbi:hypothetical protein [Endozoicomonas sp. OPT23]|uniref:hypothetical protein n=1 Tax=Endozoicomonas sp. OPT23 TaxID=2072845 RepID=UPI0018910BCB|nr:hypothetical protein [Endozoicomonas sp. OPT23]
MYLRWVFKAIYPDAVPFEYPSTVFFQFWATSAEQRETIMATAEVRVTTKQERIALVSLPAE